MFTVVVGRSSNSPVRRASSSSPAHLAGRGQHHARRALFLRPVDQCRNLRDQGFETIHDPRRASLFPGRHGDDRRAQMPNAVSLDAALRDRRSFLSTRAAVPAPRALSTARRWRELQTVQGMPTS